MPSPSHLSGESPATDAGAFLAHEAPAPAGHFDELRSATGTLRDPWLRFAASAGDISPHALAHASSRIARQMHEHGVTYNVYESTEGPVHAWALDVLPFLLTATEWREIEQGLIQQAQLLNVIAQDIYGERRLITERLVPPELVFGHRGFVRSAVGAAPHQGTFLHIAAFDLARDPSGRWHLMGARLQAPSGLGYALENRAAIARIFPDALRELGVRPLDACADILLRALTANVPSSDEEPRAVILTPGPYNETYFEHLFLARSLGLTLVQGGDLTVRQDRVFLKTVAGLRPVHAIWRRVDDDFSDPLELLRSDSTLGVAGLVQAWRTGRVLMANAFGLGVLESPALLPCLPALAERLLQEPLKLPVVRTGWHEPTAAGVAGEAPLSLGVIKPALSAGANAPVFGRLLDASGRSSWMNRLRANPNAYVVQDYMPLSQAPVWRDGGLESRGHMLRAFVVSDGHGSYQVLPAALTRVTMDDRLSVSAQRGGASKDTWILGGGTAGAPARTADRRVAVPAHAERRTVTSRAAEHLFWMGRYAERSENAARLTRTILTRLAAGGVPPPALTACMVRRTTDEGLLSAADLTETADAPGTVPVARLIQALSEGVFDRTTRNGLAFNVDHTTRAAAAIRERLSYDNWRLLAQLSRRLAPRPRPSVDIDAALEAVDDAILSLVAAGGLEMAHMTRDDGWRFLSLGRHLERQAFMAATLMSVPAADGTEEPAVLDWVLDLSDSLITYRTRYRRVPDWPSVVDLLLFDERNPRSVLFQANKLARHVRLLPGGTLDDLVAELTAIERARRSEADDDGRDVIAPPSTSETVAFLGSCHGLAERLSDALTLQYFSHVYDTQHATMNA